MIERDKVIRALENCNAQIKCKDCPWKPCEEFDCKYSDYPDGLIQQALALLKAQEPRVMTWAEAQANVNEGPFIIMEVRDSTGTEIDYGVLVDDSYEMSEGSLLTVCDFWMLEEEYGKRFRCWTSRPTDEQREAVKWE